MIELSEKFLNNNFNALIDNLDAENMMQITKEQPSLRSFVLSYGQEEILKTILKSWFDSVRKPVDERGSEKSADALCLKDGKEYRFQLKQIVTESIRQMNNIKNGAIKHLIDPKLIRSRIECTPNHSKPFYKRNELDVMVADVSPLHGVPTFLYKMIDDFKSPSQKQKDSKIRSAKHNFDIHEDIEDYIEPTNNIIYDPAGFYENGWTENLNEITSKLFSNDYNLRNYNINSPEQIIKDRTWGPLLNYLN